MKTILALIMLFLVTASGAAPGFYLDAYAEKSEKVAVDVGKELNWSSIKTKEELFLEYIANKNRKDAQRIFYCSYQIVKNKEDLLPDLAKILVLIENDDKFAGAALPLLYTRDRRLVDPLKKIVEDKNKSIKIRGLSAAILATYTKSEAYAKEKWKVEKQKIYTSEFNRLEKAEIKPLLDYVDELKFREDIGVDMFLWIKPGIFDFVQTEESADAVKDRLVKKEAILKDLRSDKKDKRENAVFSLLNLPFPGRSKLLEGIAKTDSDPGVKKSAKLYVKVLERIKQEKAVLEKVPAPATAK